MKVPCQITQWYLLPAISAEMVRELKKVGMKQAEIARMLGVTPAAVSQYVKGKRGKMVTLPSDIRKRISASAKKISSSGISEDELSREICELCILARKSRAVCEIHQKLSHIDKNCTLCTAV
ncbi:MAG: helix-turn-helix domain-containing protein [Candidatus Micrarchaeota archaeon]